jgi:hypothetical protein
MRLLFQQDTCYDNSTPTAYANIHTYTAAAAAQLHVRVTLSLLKVLVES